MYPLKRDFIYMSVVAALAFAFALAWGRPFVSPPAGHAQDVAQPQQQAAQDQANAEFFTGTVVRNGDTYALRDSSGAIYGLDDSQRVGPFEGEAVKVTGQLDPQAKVIHVRSIAAGEV